MGRSIWKGVAGIVLMIGVATGGAALASDPASATGGGAITSCTQAAFQGALDAGGSVKVECSGTIALTSPLTFSKGKASLNATGQSVIIDFSSSGSPTDTRLFEISGGTLSLTGITFEFGVASGTDGKDGAFGTDGTTGSAGSFPGGTGGDGGDAKNGGNGGNGKSASGGCFEIGSGATVAISDSTIEDCSAGGGWGGEGGGGGEGGVGGVGGAGDNGTGSSGAGSPGGTGGAGGNAGNGGNGGNGGKAEGGAIHNSGTLLLTSDMLSGDSAVGGLGNIGGDGGFAGSGGNGGNGAMARRLRAMPPAASVAWVGQPAPEAMSRATEATPVTERPDTVVPSSTPARSR